MKRSILALCVIAGFVIAGCSGGSSGTSSVIPHSSTGTTTSGSTASASFTVKMPAGWTPSSSSSSTTAQLAKTSTTGVKPQYVSLNTESVTFQASYQSSPTVLALNTSDCTDESGTYVCSDNDLTLDVGSWDLTVDTYASDNGTGDALSVNTVPITVVQGPASDNAITVTLNGIAHTLVLSLSPSAVEQEVSSAVTATWSALDASGATIVGPGTIEDVDGNAVVPQLADSDTSGDTSIGTYNSTTDSWPVTYNGGDISSPTFTLSAPNNAGLSSVGQELTVNLFTSTVVHPAATGDTFEYTGTLTQGVTYAYPTSSPEPATNQTASVTQAITVTGTPCPSTFSFTPYDESAVSSIIDFSCSGQSDFDNAEVDAYPLQTLYPTTQAWYGLADSGAQWVLFGSSVADGDGDTFITQYTSPYILDELPETQGSTWSNSPASNYYESDADGSFTEMTTASTGTYALSQSTNAGYAIGITTSATGNSVYAGACTTDLAGADCTGYFAPLGAMADTADALDAGSQFGAWNGGDYGIVIEPPSGTTITVAVESTPSTKASAKLTTIATPHAWYTPINGDALYSETDSIPAVGASIPGACNVPSEFGTTANEIEQQITDIDPVVGFISNETVKTWNVTGYGPVCVQMTDVEDEYYNWTGSTGRETLGEAGAADWSLAFSPLGSETGDEPASVETITETLTLQSASGSDVSEDAVSGHAGKVATSTSTRVSSTSAKSSSATTSTQGLTPIEVGYARARFDALIQHARTQRLRNFEKTMQRLMQAGGNHE